MSNKEGFRTVTSGPVLHYPDSILFNGKVVTADREFNIAEAVAIREGKFIAVGTNTKIQALIGPNTLNVDLAGKTVLPGLISSHCHPEPVGEKKLVIDLSKAKNVSDALAAMKEFILTREPKPGEWVKGGRWHPVAQLQEERYLTRWEVDSVAPDNPVFLPTVGHFAMANSYALRLAKITKDTPDPEGGKIDRDPATGEPDGILVESAINLVSKLVPPWSFDQEVEIRKIAMAIYNSAGFTSVVVGFADRSSLEAYKYIWANKEMTARLSLMWRPVDDKSVSLDEFEDTVRKDSGLIHFGDEWLSISGFKMAMDGGMTLRTAYTRDPYSDDPKYYGFPVSTPERLSKLVAICNRYGWRVGIHCVGDAAIDKVLDAYEYANKEKSIVDRRFVLLHASLIQPDQIERARSLGARTDIQNVFMWDKGATVKRFLGEARANRACPQRWLIDIMGIESGGAGADYPANTYNPFINMYIMVTRKDHNGVVYGADQAITRQEAIRLYTNGSAAYTFEEQLKGSIEPGKLADLVVISDDILTCPEAAIKDIRALMTIVGGKIVYQSPDYQPGIRSSWEKQL